MAGMSPDQLIESIQKVSEGPPHDLAVRKQVSESLRKAYLALETEEETLSRVLFSGLQICASKAAIDLNIFQILSRSEEAQSVKQLSDLTGAQELLLGRLLRFLASHALVEETAPDQFAASKATRVFADPGYAAGVSYTWRVELPCWEKLPTFLKSTNYNNISDGTNSPFGLAHSTNLHAFEWGMQRPDIVRDFQLYLGATVKRSWLDVFPRNLLTAQKLSKTPLFVDVGGGVGAQCAAVRKAFPDEERGIILQELAGPLTMALSTPGVENQEYDFFREQPVKGASFYYLKDVLHDWSDDSCRAILKNQILAMSNDSAILIDEMVLPDAGVHWRATAMDMTMMCNAGALERTQSQWKSLFASVGLHIQHQFVYNDATRQSILFLSLS